MWKSPPRLTNAPFGEQAVGRIGSVNEFLATLLDHDGETFRRKMEGCRPRQRSAPRHRTSNLACCKAGTKLHHQIAKNTRIHPEKSQPDFSRYPGASLRHLARLLDSTFAGSVLPRINAIKGSSGTRSPPELTTRVLATLGGAPDDGAGTLPASPRLWLFGDFGRRPRGTRWCPGSRNAGQAREPQVPWPLPVALRRAGGEHLRESRRPERRIPERTARLPGTPTRENHRAAGVSSGYATCR